MKCYLTATILVFGFSTQAATSVQLPVLLEQDGKIKEVREFKDAMTKASITLPETVDLNLLETSGDVLPKILNAVDKLSLRVGQRVILVTDASIGTFTNAKLKKQLCYKGEPQMALRLLPHVGESFFSYNTVWVGYRLKGQTNFSDFEEHKIIDIAKILEPTQALKLLQDGSQKDLQILTKLNTVDSKIQLDSISQCQ